MGEEQKVQSILPCWIQALSSYTYVISNPKIRQGKLISQVSSAREISLFFLNFLQKKGLQKMGNKIGENFPLCIYNEIIHQAYRTFFQALLYLLHLVLVLWRDVPISIWSQSLPNICPIQALSQTWDQGELGVESHCQKQLVHQNVLQAQKPLNSVKWILCLYHSLQYETKLQDFLAQPCKYTKTVSYTHWHWYKLLLRWEVWAQKGKLKTSGISSEIWDYYFS